eukprot:CAMPEP_0203894272 /NCGR_PEP_ID=MMETSP0359-20131031/37272_1 /ASSEMBLY_ACC=CAM_ASM_000338 /TAXON_ID=268821 /ORGANISM="Scrippsiella Hangoei, Strain SHTV-5" /LENGTH=183 /DNA_ID=CAMNT_0050816555 /DNA_START=1012 /DNA_END=1563 /DNA_ORIENTATION=-
MSKAVHPRGECAPRQHLEGSVQAPLAIIQIQAVPFTVGLHQCCSMVREDVAENVRNEHTIGIDFGGPREGPVIAVLENSAPHLQEYGSVQPRAKLAAHFAIEVDIDDGCVHSRSRARAVVAVYLVPIAIEDAREFSMLEPDQVKLVTRGHDEAEAEQGACGRELLHVAWQCAGLHAIDPHPNR